MTRIFSFSFSLISILLFFSPSSSFSPFHSFPLNLLLFLIIFTKESSTKHLESFFKRFDRTLILLIFSFFKWSFLEFLRFRRNSVEVHQVGRWDWNGSVDCTDVMPGTLYECDLHYFTLLYSTLLYSTVLYLTFLYSTFFWSFLMLIDCPIFHWIIFHY